MTLTDLSVMDLSVTDDMKSAVRARARTVRTKAHAVGSLASSQAGQLLLGFLTPFSGKVIAGYMPIGTEIDPRSVMKSLCRRGPVAVPVVEAIAQPLRFDLWTPETALIKGAFGAMVPEHSEPVAPDVLIVPLLAFSRHGHRLGYGGRFL